MNKDGWHTVKGYDVYVEDGKVVRGTAGEGVNYRTVYPYIAAEGGGWVNASKTLTLSALRKHLNKRTAKFF